uniref:Uncharacterized protein n=1 Tax=Timema cristinae TaxID=61476 RepID=A0A7R9CPL7_TIMCR|nr:unnamed protein product [Timema cristinae]
MIAEIAIAICVCVCVCARALKETEAWCTFTNTITSKASQNVVSGLWRECCLVKERQRVVALHLYYRRAQDQEENDRKPDGRHALRDRSGEDLSGAVREQMLYESLLAMRRVFPVGEEAVPLLLCILKQSRSLHEASWKIIQDLL